MPLLLFFPPWYQMEFWLTPGLCLSTPPPSLCTGHILTTSRWFRGEDCGRAINWAAGLCQAKLPLLFLQQSSSNYGGHASVERSSAIWCCFVTVSCHSAWMRKEFTAEQKGASQGEQILPMLIIHWHNAWMKAFHWDSAGWTVPLRFNRFFNWT